MGRSRVYIVYTIARGISELGVATRLCRESREEVDDFDLANRSLRRQLEQVVALAGKT